MQAVKRSGSILSGTVADSGCRYHRKCGKDQHERDDAAVLEQKFQVLKTLGNFNNELGLPLTVFRLREEDEIAVLEMGISDFGEMHRLASMHSQIPV